MIGPKQNEPQPGPGAADNARDPEKELPYVVELWDEAGARVERAIARAMSRALAQVIYTAAQSEFPGRRISLRRGSERVMDTRAT
jgi:hypothetical protein